MTPIKRRMPPRFEPGPVSLLSEILADRPNLQGARCIGQHELFDLVKLAGHCNEGSSARAKATAICRACPARGQCPDSLVQH